MLAEDGCVDLEAVLRAFNAPVSEEQAWALAYEASRCLAREWKASTPPNRGLYCISHPSHLRLHRDGWVHESSVRPRAPPESDRELASSESKLVVSLGLTLFRALDYGLCEDEERTLSPGLERLIDRMTSAEPAADEGIDSGEDENGVPSLAAVMEMCAARKPDPEHHYRSVCRDLISEVLELTSFMDTIQQGSQELVANQEDRSELDKAECQDWARIWVQVIKELRQGVRLRKVDSPARAAEVQYELTPYEKLLDDIRSRRYTLNKVMVNGDVPPRVKKDAHTLILEFIRSRPPLSPASRRKLPPAPPAQMTVYEKLMYSLKQKPKLRSTQTMDGGGGEGQGSAESTPPPRRLIKADLTLRLSASFDEDDDMIPPSPTDHTCTPPSPDDTSIISERPPPQGKSKRPPPLADYWQSSQWQSLECLSLTLEEVAHIRSVLTKAELESLLFDMDLFQEVDKGKVCFTCRKTKFSTFFGTKGVRCKLCERVVCDRCYSKMRIPGEHFANIPVYLLSPASSPPPEPEEGSNSTLWSLPQALQNWAGGVEEDSDASMLRHSGSTGSLNTEASSTNTATNTTTERQPQRRLPLLQRSKTVSHPTKPTSRGTVAPICCDCKELVCHIRQECQSPLN